MSVIDHVKYMCLIATCIVNAYSFVQVGASCFISANGTNILENNLNYWSEELEEVVFKDSFKDIELMKLDLSNKKLIEIGEGCGKMHNRLGILSDGTKICVRYRENSEQIQGEFVSYLLSRLLGFKNIIDAKLLVINKTEEFWNILELSEHSWENLELVVATRYIEDARPVYVPRILLMNSFKLSQNVSMCGLDEIVLKYLIQWSDMVIFDYLIGNFDRFVSNMFNLQWYSQSLVQPVENLIQSSSGFWMFIDNEDGFSHGYRLLDKYEPYLKTLLKNLCIFRRHTVSNIARLSNLNQEEIWGLLSLEAKRTFTSATMADRFSRLADHNLSILKQRIDFVHHHILICNKQAPQ